MQEIKRKFTVPPKWIVGILLFLMIVACSSYTLFMHFFTTDDLILKKDLTCNFREEVYVEKFISKLNGELLNNYLIDTNEVGTKVIEFQYKNRYGLVVKKKVDIEVLDVTPPTVVVQSPYTIEKGSIAKLEDTIFCADDYDDNVECKIIGTYDLNKEGKYQLKIEATDHSNNSTSEEFTLNVVSKLENKKNTNTKQEYTSFKSVYQKYKTKDTKIGLDLSKWQEEVDFSKLKEQEVSFVMLKIGGQKEIGGEFIVDPRFYENLEKAKENEIEVGVYFYSYATSIKEAQKQAKWIVQKLKNNSLDLPIAFDWENWSTYSTFHMSFHTLNKVADAFLKEVERNGYESILYSSKYYLETIWYPENYSVWLAYYTKNNDYEGEYQLWQVCSDGKIDGINGYVDIDILYMN